MLHLALASLVTHALSQALLGFRGLDTLTAFAVVAMPVLPAFASVGVVGVALLLARLMSPAWPQQSVTGIFRGIAALFAPNHLTTEDVIAPLRAWSWLGGSWAIARAATCPCANKNHPKDPAPPAPTPPLARFCQSAGARSRARNARKSDIHFE